ncbi:MAG: MoaD/ThiS family protein [Pirellulaceae bacterium]|jgi:sulfur carrier protein ThiS|nr:MoaD/ThiS family protein [Pirellulaceae bacterium]MDP7020158.1 MoaD/ThiS family protein [Pirellulaceae bacterium]
MNVRLTVTGRMYHTAATLPEQWDVAEDATVSDLLDQVNARLESPLPPSCLVAVGDEHLGALAAYENRALRIGDEVVLIVPVAGG